MKKKIRNQLLSCVAVVGLLATASSPANAETAFTLDGELTGSAAFTTDYRFRGISKTFRDPALQASVDFDFPNRFYMGAFTSTIDKATYTNSRGFEFDLYGGYKMPLARDFTLDVGLIQYLYPTSGEFSTLELYAGIKWQWLSFRINNSLSNRFFGTGNARDSRYYDLTGTYPLRGDLNLIGHFGVQTVANNDGGFSDYRIGVEKTWRGLLWNASVYGTDVDEVVYNASGRGVQTGGRGLVVSVSKNF